MTFERIDENFFISFIEYCTELKLTNNSVGRLIEIIKSFRHYYLLKGIHQSDKFIKELKVCVVESTQISLSEEEVKQIEDAENLSQRLIKTRDLLLMQIYTGLRASDLFALRPENVNFKEKIISFTTVKTQNQLEVPIKKKQSKFLKSIIYNYLRMHIRKIMQPLEI